MSWTRPTSSASRGAPTVMTWSTSSSRHSSPASTPTSSCCVAGASRQAPTRWDRPTRCWWRSSWTARSPRVATAWCSPPPATSASAAPWVGPRMGYESLVVLPAEMSAERFEKIGGYGADLIKTPGSESNVKEIYDKVKELRGDPRNAILQQFAEMGNYRFHYRVTGDSAIDLVQEASRRRRGQRSHRGVRVGHGLGRDHRRRRSHRAALPRGGDGGAGAGAVPDALQRRLRRPPHRGHRRQARHLDPSRRGHGPAVLHRRRGLPAPVAAGAGRHRAPGRGRRFPGGCYGPAGSIRHQRHVQRPRRGEGRPLAGPGRRRQHRHHRHRRLRSLPVGATPSGRRGRRHGPGRSPAPAGGSPAAWGPTGPWRATAGCAAAGTTRSTSPG